METTITLKGKAILLLSCAALAWGCFAGGLDGLPEAWAPFARGEAARQAVERLSFGYRTGPIWNQSKELYPWGEFASGDKSVLVCGSDSRVAGMGAGGAGFGHLALYAGKNEHRKPGQDFLGEFRIRIREGGPWNEPWKGDRFSEDATNGTFAWERPWALAGTNGVFRYVVSAAGRGLVKADWDCGVDRAAWDALGLGKKIDFFLDVPKGRPAAQKTGDFACELNADDPARHVSVRWSGAGPTGRVAFDFHDSTAPLVAPAAPTGACDFWRTDAYDVPRKPGRDWVMNGGFEQGLKGWRFIRGASYAAVTNAPGVRFSELTDEAKFGRYALKLRHVGAGERVAVATAPMPLVPGKVYTASWWARTDRRNGSGIACCPDPAGDGEKQEFPEGAGNGCVGLGTEWKRGSRSFVASQRGTTICFFVWGGDVWLDGVRVEEGTATTDDSGAPVEARLVTADEFNHLTQDGDLKARLLLSGRPGLTGAVDLRVENYYHESVWSGRREIALDAAGRGEIAIPELTAESVGTGVFFLRQDFHAAGLDWRDYTRFVVLKPLDGKSPVSGVFAHFPWFRPGAAYKYCLSAEFSDLVGRRMRDWGVGATSWQSNKAYAQGPWAAAFRKWGVVNKMHAVQTDIEVRHPDRFGWGKRGLAAMTNAAPEELSFIEAEAYRSAMDADPTDLYWTLSNEEELWHPLVKAQKYDTYFKYQLACWKGLKRGFDERGMKFCYAPTHGTSSYCQPYSYAVLDGYLDAAAKQGFRYTCMSVHTYHAIDGSILGAGDREEGTRHLLKRMKHYGYPDDIPILFPEGFNVLPLHIPEWGAKDWADNYHDVVPSHALGGREALQAAAIARIYLTDLKFYPQVKVIHTWQTHPFFDMAFTPYCFPMVCNTVGRLLPDPRFVGDARPYPDVRACCYRPTPDAKETVTAVWTSANDVESGVRKGDVLEVDLPRDVRFFDLMGNERRPTAAQRGRIPLTAAPLFIVSSDGEGVLKAIREARGGTTPLKEPLPLVELAVPHAAGTAPDWRAVATVPMTNGAAALDAVAKFAWTDDGAFHVRVEADAAGDPALEVAIDGLGDAHDISFPAAGPDDCAFLFEGGKTRLLREVNTQFRDGGAGHPPITQDEVAKSLRRAYRREGGRDVWEIAFTTRFISPVRVAAGVRFGLNLTVRSAKGPASLAPSAIPAAFPLLTFR